MRLLTDENGFFCPTCWQLPTRIQRPFCSQCGRPHPRAVGFHLQPNFPCAECNAMSEPKPYRHVFGAAVYEGAAADAVKILKFRERKWIVQPIVEELHQFVTNELDVEPYSLVVPVPLHRIRYRDRGFNQAELIARPLSELFPNAQFSQVLQRIRPTRTQSRLSDPTDRQENVRGAFAVDRDIDLTGERVLLIDDVVTTGGTVGECARALRRAGAAYVDVLAFALAV